MNQYTEMTDDALVDVLKKDHQNDDAFVALRDRFSAMIASLARKYFGDADLEEQIAEGGIVLFKIIDKYKPGGSAKFSTYARTCINNHFLDTLRQRQTARRIPADRVSSLDDDSNAEVESTTDGTTNPEQQVIRREEVEAIVKTLRSQLSATEYTVWSECVYGFSTAEIAEKHAMDPKAVSNALARARKKISLLFPSS